MIFSCVELAYDRHLYAMAIGRKTTANPIIVLL